MLLTTRSKKVQEIFRTRHAVLEENRAQAERRVSPHNPLRDELPDGAWAGQACFVIGGGPSLTGFDFERLRGRGRVIAINRAFEFIPWADMLFFMDWKFYKRCHEPGLIQKWNDFRGHKVFMNLMGRKLDDCRSVRSLGRHGFSASHAKGLYHGNNSGHGALMMALALGCRPVYLLGYDMNADQRGRSHWHGGYGHRPNPTVARSFVRDLTDLAGRIPKSVDWIFNLNPRSGLKAFPFKSVDEVLNGQAGEGLGPDVVPLPQ